MVYEWYLGPGSHEPGAPAPGPEESASLRGGTADTVVRILAILGLTLPSFWVGVLMLHFASVYLPLWPTIGYVPFADDPGGNLARMALPVIAVSLPMIAGLSRILRSSLLDVLSLDYIRTGRAKGLARRTLLYKHALRNAMIPVITVIGVQVGYLLSGVVVIEQVFAIPGIGRLVIGAIILLASFGFNLFGDCLRDLLDPALRNAAA